MNHYDSFKQFHHQSKPLLLGNVWNPQSALLYQKLGFKAIGTSSAAIATSLGYEDGEKMPFSDLLSVVKHIVSKINIPLTVDIEAGYSRDINEIINNIKNLQKLGVVGINIEDSVVNETREIADANEFGLIIQSIKRDCPDIFLNVRTDYYIMGLPNPLEATLQRVKIYATNGADGIFVPGITVEEDIRKVIRSTSLPINVMCMPTLTDFDTLQALGVKRISVGPFLYNNMLGKLENSIQEITKNNSFKSIFA